MFSIDGSFTDGCMLLLFAALFGGRICLIANFVTTIFETICKMGKFSKIVTAILALIITFIIYANNIDSQQISAIFSKLFPLYIIYIFIMGIKYIVMGIIYLPKYIILFCVKNINKSIND